uniref:Mersacidin/lichenicidin family type 2 lantibiotic n=1 Tax=Panagrellus redivivus TaxID=6233 RepID=A0A7E4ZTF1_PANRE
MTMQKKNTLQKYVADSTDPMPEVSALPGVETTPAYKEQQTGVGTFFCLCRRRRDGCAFGWKGDRRRRPMRIRVKHKR